MIKKYRPATSTTQTMARSMFVLVLGASLQNIAMAGDDLSDSDQARLNKRLLDLVSNHCRHGADLYAAVERVIKNGADVVAPMNGRKLRFTRSLDLIGPMSRSYFLIRLRNEG